MADKLTLKRLKPRVPAPNRWPAWLHYVVMVAVFVAGIQAGVLWLTTPWVLIVFVSIISVMLFLLWTK